jgi:hypothetical protein
VFLVRYSAPRAARRHQSLFPGYSLTVQLFEFLFIAAAVVAAFDAVSARV